MGEVEAEAGQSATKKGLTGEARKRYVGAVLGRAADKSHARKKSDAPKSPTFDPHANEKALIARRQKEGNSGDRYTAALKKLYADGKRGDELTKAAKHHQQDEQRELDKAVARDRAAIARRNKQRKPR